MSRHSARTRHVSVRARIILAILLVAALGMGALTASVYLVERQRALGEVGDRMYQLADELTAIAEGDEVAAPPATVESFLNTAMQRILPEPNESVLGILNGEAAYVPDANLPFRIDADARFVKFLVASADPTAVVTGTSILPVGTVQYSIVPLAVTGDDNSGFYVSAFLLDRQLDDAGAILRTSIAVSLVALLLIGAVGWFVSGRLLRPLRRLREAAGRMSASDLSERIPVRGHDDVSLLTVTVNDLVDRLERAFTAQRQLVDDVSHELRTPITIIQGHLELLDGRQPDRVDRVRELALDELARMSALVTELSVLAESGTTGFVVRLPTDVDELLSDLAAKAKALSPRHSWRVRSDTDALVPLDGTRITQAYLQLCQNAVKYSDVGSIITLGGETVGDGAARELRLWVRDEGVGVAEADQQRVFERFHRVETGRGVEGSGLGLSIVRAITHAHGGSVLLDSEPGVGSTFTMVLPAAEPVREEVGVS
ncbi:HAMP domain-containing sensor histidine kinase [Salinibacterium sp. ZJ454]|uniref:sensor histidine kinase n=1 Tax=Salinibacterium sp. ZJ454 TaxID=2708339 RepID=UPI001423AF6C|nr:HAMP domain-containing sensor histidine kinase [Salinibacterium sp. ZJ454]